MNRDPRLHFPTRSPRAAAIAAARRALRGGLGADVDSEIAIEATVRGVMRTLGQFDRWLEQCASEECGQAVREAIARGELAAFTRQEELANGDRPGPEDQGHNPPPVLRFVAGPSPATIRATPL